MLAGNTNGRMDPVALSICPTDDCGRSLRPAHWTDRRPNAGAPTADSSRSTSASGYDLHHELFVFVRPVDSLHPAAAHDFIVFAVIRVRSHERHNHVVRPPPLVRKPASCPIERRWTPLNAPLQGLQYFEGHPRLLARFQNFVVPEIAPNDHVSVEQLRKKWSRYCARVSARRCDENRNQGADCRKQKFHPPKRN